MGGASLCVCVCVGVCVCCWHTQLCSQDSVLLFWRILQDHLNPVKLIADLRSPQCSLTTVLPAVLAQQQSTALHNPLATGTWLCSTALRQGRAFKKHIQWKCWHVNLHITPKSLKLSYHQHVTSPACRSWPSRRRERDKTGRCVKTQERDKTRRCLKTRRMQWRISWRILTWSRSFCPTWMSSPSSYWLSLQSQPPVSPLGVLLLEEVEGALGSLCWWRSSCTRRRRRTRADSTRWGLIGSLWQRSTDLALYIWHLTCLVLIFHDIDMPQHLTLIYHDISYLTFDIFIINIPWHWYAMTFDIWHSYTMTFDTWHLTLDILHFTFGIRHLTFDMTEGTDSTDDIGTILSHFHWWILRLS